MMNNMLKCNGINLSINFYTEQLFYYLAELLMLKAYFCYNIEEDGDKAIELLKRAKDIAF